MTNECSDCFLQIDDAASILGNNGYFEITPLFEKIYNEELTVAISNKVYTDISSTINITLENKDKNIEYSFTDALEYYNQTYSSDASYTVTVTQYDDDILTGDISCFEEETETTLMRSSGTTTEDIIVLNYQGELKVFTKFTFSPLIKETLYLFNESDESDSYMHPIMNQAFDDAKEIYIKNGFDVLEYTLIETPEQLDALTLNKRNMLFYFVKHHPGQAGCTAGRTEFKDGTSLIMEKHYNNCGSSSYVNLGALNYQNNAYESGYTLAHEILHVFTIRGSRLMELPIRKGSLEYYCPGGHFNWTSNLLMSGTESGPIPIKNSNVLHDDEKIILEAKYLMFKFLLSNVN